MRHRLTASSHLTPPRMHHCHESANNPLRNNQTFRDFLLSQTTVDCSLASLLTTDHIFYVSHQYVVDSE